jgi:hypothetical protein
MANKGKCLERATAAFLILSGQLLSTWRQQRNATLGKTADSISAARQFGVGDDVTEPQ